MGLDRTRAGGHNTTLCIVRPAEPALQNEDSAVYAIIEESGKQFKVNEGDLVKIDLVSSGVLDAEAPLEFTRVLLVSDGESTRVGTPLVDGAKVVAEVVKPLVKGKKVRAFKYKRRKGYHRNMGHRQKYTEVRITQIVA